MDSKSRVVLGEALSLPDADRAAIAAALLATLSPEGTALGEDELEDELVNRLEECRNDPAASVSWTELKDAP